MDSPLLKDSETDIKLHSQQYIPNRHFSSFDTKDPSNSKSFRTQLLVRKFVSKLKKKSVEKNNKNFQTYQFEIIDDKTFFPVFDFSSPNVKKNLKSNILKAKTQFVENSKLKIKAFMKKIPVFSPENWFVLIFRILWVISIMLNLTYIPLSFTLSVCTIYEEPTFGVLFFDCPFFLSIFNTIIMLNTGYYYKGAYITNRKKIFRFFLKDFFIYDIFIFFSQTTFYASNFPFLKLALLLRILIFLKLVKILEINLMPSGNTLAIYKLFKLFFFNFYVAHLMALFWIVFNHYEIELGLTSQIIFNNLYDKNMFCIYIDSLYFIFATMITVGYGDFSPVSVYEKILGICTMFIACGMFAYTLNYVGETISVLSQSRREFMKKVSTIHNYLNKKSINPRLKERIISYVEWKHAESMENDAMEREVVNSNISQALEMELNKDYYIRYIRKNQFCQNFSEDFLNSLCQIVKEEGYIPGESIFEKGESSNSKFFFVIKGKVNLCHIKLNFETNKEKTFSIKKLKVGSFFGLSSIFTNEKREISAKSNSISTLGVIEIRDFLNLLKEHPSDRVISILNQEKFCLLKHNFVFNEDFTQIPRECYFCQGTNHPMNDCSLVSERNRIEIKLKKRSGWREQKRRNFIRREKKIGEIRNFLSKINFSQSCNSKFLYGEEKSIEEFEFPTELQKSNTTDIQDDNPFLFDFPRKTRFSQREIEIDKVHNFKLFQPKNNIEKIVKDYNKHIRARLIRKSLQTGENVLKASMIKKHRSINI